MTEMQSRIAFEQVTLVAGRRPFASVHAEVDVHFFRDRAQWVPSVCGGSHAAGR